MDVYMSVDASAFDPKQQQAASPEPSVAPHVHGAPQDMQAHHRAQSPFESIAERMTVPPEARILHRKNMRLDALEASCLQEATFGQKLGLSQATQNLHLKSPKRNAHLWLVDDGTKSIPSPAAEAPHPEAASLKEQLEGIIESNLAKSLHQHHLQIQTLITENESTRRQNDKIAHELAALKRREKNLQRRLEALAAQQNEAQCPPTWPMILPKPKIIANIERINLRHTIVDAWRTSYWGGLKALFMGAVYGSAWLCFYACDALLTIVELPMCVRGLVLRVAPWRWLLARGNNAQLNQQSPALDPGISTPTQHVEDEDA